MTAAPGWFRVSKDCDYPVNGAFNNDVRIGLGSYDVRIQGKIISGFKCFKVFIVDFYAFDIDDNPAAPLSRLTGLKNREVANLHKVGAARNFDILGETQGSCYLAPNDTRIRCPFYSKLA